MYVCNFNPISEDVARQFRGDNTESSVKADEHLAPGFSIHVYMTV